VEVGVANRDNAADNTLVYETQPNANSSMIKDINEDEKQTPNERLTPDNVLTNPDVIS
jgi:hypothetical protein